jgi:Zn-dependent alcohol dehydrogenase
VGCALLTSYGVLQNELEIEKVDPAKVLIIGFGGIGESLSLLARKISRPDIYVLDKRPSAVAKAREFGLNVVSVEEISNHQFDFIVDTTGMPRLIELAYESLSSSGVLSLVGVSPKGEKISIDPMPLHYGRRIIGSFGGSVDVDRDLPQLINLLSEHTNYFKNLAGEQFRLVDINKAISLFRQGSNQGRILLSFG